MRIDARIAGAGFSLALVILGIAAAVAGTGYGFLAEEGRVGAGFLPVVFGSALALLAAIDAIQRLLRLRQTGTIEGLVEQRIEADAEQAADAADLGEPAPLRNANGEEVDIFGRTQRQRSRILAIVIASIAATIVLTAVVGFLIACTLLVFGIAVGVERRKLLPSAVIAVITGIAVWLIFVQFLGVPLPTGLIGII